MKTSAPPFPPQKRKIAQEEANRSDISNSSAPLNSAVSKAVK